VSFGFVDTAAGGMAAGDRLRGEAVDLLVVYSTTYALSSSVLPMVQCARVPLLIGHYYSGTFDIATDLNALSATFGRVVETLDRVSLPGCRQAD